MYKSVPWVLLIGLIIFVSWFTVGQSSPQINQPDTSPPVVPREQLDQSPQMGSGESITFNKYNGVEPQQWGEQVSGVGYRLETQEKVLALTLDACGGSGLAAGYDKALIDYLDTKQIPATLFVTGNWIDANPEIFLKLAGNPLFQIANHGLNHRPASVNGRSAYNIQGTGNQAELIQEIAVNGEKIDALTGGRPRYYRSGTNFYDEIAISMAHDLGYVTVGYGVAGDAGATFSREQVKKTLLGARAGSIILMHFNHPEGQTAEGLMDAIPVLEQNGFKFVSLSAGPLLYYP